MSIDLDRQLREYCRQLDEKQGALTFEDILERTGELQVIPGRGNQQVTRRRKWFAAAALVVLITALSIWLFPGIDGIPQPADQPSTPSLTTPTTLASKVDSLPPLEVHGWPDTSENAAGVYSWDGRSCAGSFCNYGWMHNGYGSGDVEILFDVVPERPNTDDGATAVTIAGHDGIHRRINASREEWIVDIEGRMIAIRLIAKPSTSQADLAEAHAIIHSIRTEPMDNGLFGFRLLFTLSTNDWDSG